MIEFNVATPLYEDTSIDTFGEELEKVEVCTSALTSDVLLGPASAFLSNIQAMSSMLDMPRIVSAYSQGYSAATVLKFAGEYLADKGSLAQDLKEAFDAEDWEDNPKAYNLMPSLVSDSDSVRVAVESQLALVTAAEWTALETLVRDVWVGAVNSFPEPLARYTLNAQSDGNELRTIKVNWLAKYSFDLRNCMGTVLAEDEAKFRFRSPDQIIKAYKVIFQDNKEVNQMWTAIKKDLNLLNLTRNLVAHRAGAVDERFNRQAKLELPVGERLPLNTQNVHQFLSLVVNAGCEHLALCETALSKYSPH